LWLARLSRIHRLGSRSVWLTRELLELLRVLGLLSGKLRCLSRCRRILRLTGLSGKRLHRLAGDLWLHRLAINRGCGRLAGILELAGVPSWLPGLRLLSWIERLLPGLWLLSRIDRLLSILRWVWRLPRLAGVHRLSRISWLAGQCLAWLQLPGLCRILRLRVRVQRLLAGLF